MSKLDKGKLNQWREKTNYLEIFQKVIAKWLKSFLKKKQNNYHLARLILLKGESAN